MKLTDEDKKILLDWGHPESDFEQIQRAISKTIYELYSGSGEKQKISCEKARVVLGQKKFLSGISRSAFHYTSLRETADGRYVSFDTHRLFEENEKDEEKYRRNELYKRVCKGYISTISKELILENTRNLHHITIQDKYIDKAQKGEINLSNYKKYLEDEMDYTYKNYEEFFSNYVADGIKEDETDIGFYNCANNTWDYPVSKDDLEALNGLGYNFDLKNPDLEEIEENEI